MLLFLVNSLLFFANIFAVFSASLPQDSVHLLGFRSGLPELSQQLLPWNQSVSHCQWKGVTCYLDKTSHVELLNLTGLLLSGTLDKAFPNLCRLPRLVYLDLSGNHFTGGIPNMLGNCSQLDTIFLNNNTFSGSIPPEIFKSTKLLYLDLGYNQLNGTIPSEVRFCTSLQQLVLWNNFLSGNIPKELFDLPNLTLLYLEVNELTGPLPDFPSSCSLSELSIDENRFSGSLPISLSNCHNLTAFFATSAHLGGVISPEVFMDLSNLESLYLHKNSFEGEIPETLWNGSLQELSLSLNKFNGSISEKIGGCHQLNFIDLSYNKLTGQLPRSVGRLKNLNKLFLYNNSLSGLLPAELGNCTSLVGISLAANFIGGKIPQELCNLHALNVRRNMLAGRIPAAFGYWTNLSEIDLSDNMFSGSVPAEFGKLQNLVRLNISSNRLTGNIPLQLSYSAKLEELDLSNNNLSGRIPKEIASSSVLTNLLLQDNKLSGALPDTFSSSQKLLKLYLGHNLLECPIPCSLSKLMQLVTRIWHPSLLNKHRLAKCQSGIGDLPDGITFEDIVHATEGWSEKYVIGRGKHGTVYKMESAKSNKLWAVKKVDLAQRAFSDEMRSLNSVRHRNLVRLGGYCMRYGYGFILTEFIPGGTLHDVLHQIKPPVNLDWKSRHRIALGIAQGLSYLHHDSVPQIIHRDLKSDNVMLDCEMEPKIVDFGIAKAVSDSDENSTNSKIVGTLGYIAPENAYSVQLTEKSDVYSYGVLLLELFCRKMPVDPSFEEGLDIVFWVRKNLHRGNNNFLYFLDEEISLWDVEEQWKALKIVYLALQCAELEASARHKIMDHFSISVSRPCVQGLNAPIT